MRGPVSTFYGSGALGGAINFFLKNTNASSMTFGAQDQGQGIYGSYFYADEEFNIGLSHRDVGRTDSANGDVLNNAFSSTNVYIRRNWQSEDINYKLFWLETDARDIGKSNARFNQSRNTIYPSETHSLVKFQATHNDGWQASLFYHPNDLTTDNDNLDGNLIRTENSSDDLGGTFQRETSILDSFSTNIDAQWGIDWFARRNVTAYEIEFEGASQASSRSEVIQSGSLDDVALFMSAIVNQDDHNWHLGARYNTQRSSVANSSSVNEEAMTAFIGYNQSLSERLSLQLNLASGFRFPTLSERFFSGTTARGEIIAPVNLDKETSLNLDLALLWKDGPHLFQFNAFTMDVDNYIERVRLDSGERTFVNLNNGQIDGAELLYRYADEFQLWETSYTNYRGIADSGAHLADIPSDELSLNYVVGTGRWRFDIDWQFRLSKDEVGPGELPSNSYDVLDVGVEYEIDQHWNLSIAMDNVLDELYFPSNDDLDTFATGRTISVSIHWQDH
jgi:iron complex outermembrane receptor protein